MATIYGYARCSTSEDRQHIDRQINELKAAGAEEIYYEFEHGDSPVKKNLQALMENAEIQSSLIVTEVSRLSRSTQQLCELLKLIQNKQMRLIILNSITIDCRNGEIDPMSAAFLQMAGVFNELEVQMCRARVRSGVANARSKGIKLGRKPVTVKDLPAAFVKHYPSYANGMMNISELARICDLSRPTIYKYIELIRKTN